jgi:hypothetical protein
MDFSKYKNTLPYPSRDEYKTTYWYSRGVLVWEQKPGQKPVKLQTLGPEMQDCIVERTYDDDALKASRAAYNKETAELYALFKNDLFADLGIQDNPKREKLFTKAWEDGHSAGYSEVYNCALGLVDLIE